MEDDFNFVVIYDISSKTFSFTDRYRHYFLNNNCDATITELFPKNVFSSDDDFTLFHENFNSAISNTEIYTGGKRISIITQHNKKVFFGIVFSTIIPGKVVTLSFRDLSQEIDNINHLKHIITYDELTSLMNLSPYNKKINNIFLNSNSDDIAGKYAIFFFDIVKFKAINEVYGKSGGDLLLIHISEILKDLTKDNSEEFACRIAADCFSLFIKTENKNLDEYAENLIQRLTNYELDITVNCNLGIYIIDNPNLTASEMLDHAILAQSHIKGSYTHKYSYYTTQQTDQMLTEHEITAQMKKAMEDGEFVPYFQPQYNHTTGALVGAEALVRWIHPQKGIISPGIFIPIFEKNGFITPMDMYIFDKACEFLYNCIKNGLKTVPISTNFSRFDIFQPDFVEQLEKSRTKYNIPVDLLRIEITESAVYGDSDMTNEVIRKLHDHGYIVEMDDFGSGYSSLNILKDVEFDIIKLDMKFLSDNNNNGRGGTVISSIVNMAKWLKLPIIAEGVETVSQADFLSSIGAVYIQGFLYSKPLPAEDFIERIKNSSVTKQINDYRILENFNTNSFWDPKSLDTMIFSNYVGGACIFIYEKAKINVEMLRVNQKYLKEMGTSLKETDILQSDIRDFFDEENLQRYVDTLNKAIESKDEEEVECWRSYASKSPDAKPVCIRSNLRLIGNNGNVYLFYSIVRNITAEKKRLADLMESERKYKEYLNKKD